MIDSCSAQWDDSNDIRFASFWKKCSWFATWSTGEDGGNLLAPPPANPLGFCPRVHTRERWFGTFVGSHSLDHSTHALDCWCGLPLQLVKRQRFDVPWVRFQAWTIPILFSPALIFAAYMVRFLPVAFFQFPFNIIFHFFFNINSFYFHYFMPFVKIITNRKIVHFN